ncbi:arylamine N-acetyltransferase, pineal gland isozyme NAT-10-like [Salarias fasciatus]|uniref:arylamine N-acetyltransferase, pineal gland isozyme NAT-10-like n=1 Tax=Salarias fasciatus TaxID=181472 RepID=UPI0011769074|nr:arylamine N-acetyltransferase, pineal gland isozyme NAT-10-like [Salarias fasciatus]XP_029954101.1 arylamine N-acetyltransferase, pineal gland isozyme NAT-10-like [Salarias fasciatus]
MNLEEYFKRIGFQGSYEALDLPTLKMIHKRHVMSIPFENLSIHCGERITTDLQVIFDKVVRGRRGGWCMENNLLFGWVLREMGYDTTTLGARVFSASSQDFFPYESHLINKVIIDGKPHIADVSFGMSSQVWEPLELISGKDQPQAAGIFRLIEKGDVWMLEKTARKPEFLNPECAKSSLINRNLTRLVYCFSLSPRQVEDFSDINHKLQTTPTSLFTNKSICSLQTATGFKGLVGWTYSEVTYKPEEGVDVFSMRDITEEEIEEVLREQFNVVLQNKVQPVSTKLSYTM